jgi:glycosyltransferase involved in cell wall biosynthesis
MIYPATQKTVEVVPGLASVIICAYNNWPDLEMTIVGALQQSYQPVEVIVVDNSSVDATSREVPARFGSRVQYLRQANSWNGGAYNAGFAVSKGEFIQFSDGDDILAPNKIEKQVEFLRANPEWDIVYGDLRGFQTAPGRADWEDLETKPEPDLLEMFLSPGPHGPDTLGSLFRRRVMERVGPWGESLYCSDVDFFLRAAWLGCRFGYCSVNPAGFHRVHAGQMSGNALAMNCGLEIVLEKALGYITREPYRSALAAKLAEIRFFMAISREGLTRRQALAKLALARTTSAAAVPAPLYAGALLAIALPGGTALLRSPWLRVLLRPVRRALAGFSKRFS